MKFAIIGLGHFGTQLATDLMLEKHQVVAVDLDERIIDSLKDEVDLAVVADVSDMRAVARLSLDEMDVVVVAIGQDWSASLMATGHLQEIGVKRLICRSINPTHSRILSLMKVDEIIQAEEMAARQLAKRLRIRGAARHFALSDDFAIVELKAPKHIVGKTTEEANLFKEGINLITVKRVKQEGEGSKEKCSVSLLGLLSPEMCFEENDHLIVFGKDSDINRFSEG